MANHPKSALPTRALAALLLLAGLLGACGGGSPPTPAASNPATPSPPSGTPAPPPQGASLPLPFETNVTYTRTLYVDGAASINGDGSFVNPYNNIPAALRSATPGTQIRIQAGSYPPLGHYAQLQGQPGAPIAIVADGAVIIDANHNGTGLSMSDAHYILLDGLTIQNTGVHGINIDDSGSFATPSSYLVLRNMHFRNIGSGGNNDCLKLSGVTDFYISQSEFEGCNRGEAIDMVGCHRGTITGNHFHDLAGNAVQTKGGSANILIHGNRFIDMPQRAINAGGNTGDPYFRPIDAAYEAEHIRILANLFVNTGSAATVFSGCRVCLMANNTIINPNNYVAWFVEENTSRGPGYDVTFINNIIVFNDSALSNFSAFNSNNLSLTNTFVIDANLWFAQDNPGFVRVPNGYGLPMGNQSLIQADPQLAPNYSLTTGSPAIRAGLSVPGGLPADYLGQAYTAPPDLGAFSWNAN